MTPLKARLIEQIKKSGPISVASYMALCLFDPVYGYYTTREPFGRDGDFITAPEVSQMFGELIGAWLVATWRQQGSPSAPVLAEIGPGRGTLMKDALRVIDKIAPDLATSAQIFMVETSERLAEIQRNTLANSANSSGRDIAWLTSLDQTPDRPLFLVGNELFDAIPVRQFVKTGDAWRERYVGLNEAGELAFVIDTASTLGEMNSAHLPATARSAPEGAIFEDAPARSALMQTACERIARFGGAALFIDYGHLQTGIGDTLQALRQHQFDDPLANPGEADLTSHVDFEALAGVALKAELGAHLTTQGEFLLKLGLLERAGLLGAAADATARERITSEVERLAAPDQMGDLFKVLAVVAGGETPAGFEAN